jgi:pimeloyl-ACP methyl ester carboxylesterase
MMEHNVNGTRIRTAWISKQIEGKAALVIPDDFDSNSTTYHEEYEKLFGKVPIFCIDTMVRDGKSLEFGERIHISQQVDELCKIVEMEGITNPIWVGDCGRTPLAARAAGQFPNSNLLLTSPIFTTNGMKGRLSLLRQLLRSVLKDGDVKDYSYVMYLMTVGTQYLLDNPFAFMANHHRHKKITLEQRRLMLEHCFTEDDDPENMLEDISGKILIVSGTDDPVQHSRLLKQRISDLSNCTHKLYECGHHVFLEYHQAFMDDIYEFYEQVNA